MPSIIQEQPGFGSRLGQGIARGMGKDTLANALMAIIGKGQGQNMASLLQKEGVEPNRADLVSRAPKGAQSAFLKDLFKHQEPEYEDEFGGLGKYAEAEPPGSANLQEYLLKQEPVDEMEELYFEPEYEEPERNIYKEIERYVKDRNEGLSAKDASISDKDRYDKNLPLYKEFDEHRESLNRNEERFNIMQSLGKKLPKGIGRINVDSDGNLRFPFLANAETQRFVKTLNEFAKGAKDTFGARVTNFDLEQYMRTFPTLLNSQEGVKQILQQMKIVNDINKVHYNALSEVFEKAGGIRKIDYDVAKRYAEKISAPKIRALVDKFKTIGNFESLPAASEFKGKKIRDKQTGEILVSDGNEWLPQ